MGWFILIAIVVFLIWMDIRSGGSESGSNTNLKKEAAKTAAMGVGGYMLGKTLSKSISGENVKSKMKRYYNEDGSEK